MITVEEEEDVQAFANYVVETSTILSNSNSNNDLDTSASSPSAIPPPPADQNRVVRLSPAARHLLESRSIDPSNIVGTARPGIISKGDVLLAIKSGTTITKQHSTTNTTANTHASATIPSTATTMSTTSIDSSSPINYSDLPPVNDKYEDIPNSNMRKVIAKRLTESKASVPHSILPLNVKSMNF